MMFRKYVAAQDIEPGDVVLTANAEDASRIYADVANGSYVDDGYVYVPTEDGRFRFEFDQLVTVLRGVKL